MAITANPLDEFDAPSPSASNPLDEFDYHPPGGRFANPNMKYATPEPPGVFESFAQGFAGGETFGYGENKGMREAAIAAHPIAEFAGDVAGTFVPMTAAALLPTGVGQAEDAARAAQLAGKGIRLVRTLMTPSPVKGVVGATGQGIKLGSTYGALSGAGHADVGPDDTVAQSVGKQLAGAVTGGAEGAALGPAFAVGGHLAGKTIAAGADLGSRAVQAVSPTFARWAANGNAILQSVGQNPTVRNILGYDQPYPAGYVGGRGGVGAALDEESAAASSPPTVADGMPPTTDPGTRAQALQILANTWRRENVSVDDVEQALQKAADARRLNSNSYAQDVQALVDVTPGTQRLAGALYRSSTEVANRAIDFTYARQTGLVPDRGLPENAGLPAIEKFAPAMTGAQALERFGSQFDTSLKGTVPTGLYARVRRGFMRANEISDEDYHGHAATASRTDEAILDAAQADAKTDWDALKTAGDGVDVRPTIAPILQKWWKAADELPGLAGGQVKKAVSQFLRTRDASPPAAIPGTSNDAFAVNGRHPFANIIQIDNAKKTLDDQIGKLLKGGDSYAGGVVLTSFKNEVLAALDGIQQNNIGPLYNTARGKFASRMEARRMLEAGRDSLDNPEAGIDAFRSAGDDKGMQKIFRLGQVGRFEQKYGGQPTSTDVLKFFDSPNVMSLLAETLPASEREGAVFADRPRRFGRYLATERQMLTTPRKVIGGSPTAERMADDAALDSMQSVIEQFHGATGASLKTPLANMTWEGMGMQAVSHVLNKFFGYRADAAAELGRMLFTANKETVKQVLKEVRGRMGQNRFDYFSSLMQQALRNSIPARGAAATTEATVGKPNT